jgi:PAS domain S-box-containing protein
MLTQLSDEVLLAIETYLQETAPVVVLRLDQENRVVDANGQAVRLLGDDIQGRPFAEKVTHGSGNFGLPKPIVSLETAPITLNTISGTSETLYFRFFQLADGALALGGVDLAEQSKLFGELRGLNGELNDLTRKMQVANAELRELNELKTRYAAEMQEKNESLRRQALASLNLMEDAVEARERAELSYKALRDHEIQFQALVEGAPDAILVVTDSLLVYTNPAACRLFGADSPEELLGQPLFDRADPSVRGILQQRIDRVFNAKDPVPPAELVYLRLDGTPIPVEVSSIRITYLGKQSALIYMRDITERKKADEAIRRSEDRYRTILEASPDAMLSMDRQGRIVLVNTQAEKMFGYPREALLHQDAGLIFPERYREQHVQRRAALFASFQDLADGVAIETFGLRADATEFPVEIRISRLETEEDHLLLGAFRDVTERREVELRSRQLEIKVAEAEAANKAKSMFLSTMSHEIRTPMNAILGYSQLMMRDSNLAADARAHLEVINRSGEHLLEMINEVLDMAKIEAGRMQLAPKVFNLRSLVRDLESMFRLRAEAKGLRFEALLAGEPIADVIGDEGKIRQVLINLLGNAIKFTLRGWVKLQVRVTSENESRVRFSAEVEDTGIGMTSEEQREVFQLFSQALSGQRIQHGGTGLGLAISQRIARLMGGDITMTSAEQGGSVFLFDIPMERGPDQHLPSQPPARDRVLGISNRQDAPRILIAEDATDSREWLTKLLTSIGFAVRGAENGRAAVSAWEEWRPQLVLMDMHMPIMDGVAAAREIRSRPSGESALIIALTADVMDSQGRAAFEKDLNDFISKPCRENELLETIGKHLGLLYKYAEDAIELGDHDAPSQARISEPPRPLPADFAARMGEAIVHGDKALLDKLILTIEESGDISTARELRDQADRYEYDRLKEWLERVCRK